MTLHQNGISALVLHTSFRRETNGVAKCRLFFQAMLFYVLFFLFDNPRSNIFMLCFFFLSDAERKLAFLDVEGFDIFGKNSLFVPLIKWKALKEDVDTIQKAAEVYENTFNDIITSVKNKENFKQVIRLYQVFLQVRTWVYSFPQM